MRRDKEGYPEMADVAGIVLAIIGVVWMFTATFAVVHYLDDCRAIGKAIGLNSALSSSGCEVEVVPNAWMKLSAYLELLNARPASE